jgi:UDP-glucose 4-epimerase
LGWPTAWFDFNAKIWPLGNIGKKVARLPGVSRVLGPILWNEKNLDATYIPVGEAVTVDEGSVLPYRIIEDFVEKASDIFILDRCICRTGLRCESYPRHVGCIFLGDAAGDIPRELGRPATVESAMAHVTRASAAGLLPCIIHGQFDAQLLRIDYRKMLSICFCCPCCCAFRTDMKKGPAAYRDRIFRLPGLVVAASGDCSGCGACAEICSFAAVAVTEDGPVFAEYCKGCGKCADVCPTGNITIHLEKGADAERILLERIGARTDIT